MPVQRISVWRRALVSSMEGLEEPAERLVLEGRVPFSGMSSLCAWLESPRMMRCGREPGGGEEDEDEEAEDGGEGDGDPAAGHGRLGIGYARGGGKGGGAGGGAEAVGDLSGRDFLRIGNPG